MDWNGRMSRALRVAMDAAREAGRWIRREAPGLQAGDIAEKGPSDFVTRIDRGSEKILLEAIRREFPSDAILSEEAGGAIPRSEFLWVVDPVDGTNNLIHRYPRYCISVALVANDLVQVAAAYDPAHDDMYSAKRNEGVWLNGAPIGVSPVADLSRACVATGLPARHKDGLPEWLRQFGRLSAAAGSTRKTGSAVLDLAYVACGRFDAYFEPKLAPWDMAAGVLLVEAGGGVVTDDHGDPWALSATGIIAANPDLHPQVVKAVAAEVPVTS